MNTPESIVALGRLRKVGGDRLVDEVVAVFRAQAPGRLREAREAATRGDAREVARLAHALKSSCGQLGATGIFAVLEILETAAERGDLAQAAGRLDGLAIDLDAFLESLPRPEGVSGAARGARKVIGLVEDNDDTRLIVRTILEGAYAVEECATGQEALDRFGRKAPNAVLLDISLPGIDGLEVLARMRADPALARIPVVALTAHAMVGDRERFLAQGFDGYASKPILDEEELLETVRKALEQPR